MNTIKTNIFKSAMRKFFSLFLIIVFACMVSVTNADAEGTTVTKTEVIEYLETQGLKSLACNEVPDSFDWISNNSNGSTTRVYVMEGAIVGHENIDF